MTYHFLTYLRRINNQSLFFLLLIQRFPKSFYLKCIERNIKTTYDIENNFNSVKIIANNVNVNFTSLSEAIRVFQQGYTVYKYDEKIADENKKEQQRAEKEKLRKIDKADSDTILKQTAVTKNDKYLYDINLEIAKWQRQLSSAVGSFDTVTKLAVTPVDNGHRPDPAIVGGIAAGITGSNVVGVAAAYQTEQSNKRRDSETYISKDDAFKMMDVAMDRQTEAEKNLSILQNKKNAFLSKGIMYDSLDPKEKLKMLNVSDWNYTVNANDNINVTAKTELLQDVKIFDSAGVLDGSIKIICSDGFGKIAEGYFCAPGFGDTSLKESGFGKAKGNKLSIKALCIVDDNKQIQSGTKLTFRVEPINMWIAELK